MDSEGEGGRLFNGCELVLLVIGNPHCVVLVGCIYVPRLSVVDSFHLGSSLELGKPRMPGASRALASRHWFFVFQCFFFLFPFDMIAFIRRSNPIVFRGKKISLMFAFRSLIESVCYVCIQK